MAKKFGLTKTQLVDQINTEFENALNRPGDSIDQQTADAWRRFRRDKLDNEVEGDSEVVTSDVREVVMGMLPQFMRTLALADNLATFDPVGEEDEERAEQETEYINHVFWKVVPGSWLKMQGWMFSGLMERNAYAEAFWNERTVVRQEEHEGITLEKFSELSAQEGWEAVERSEVRSETVTVEEAGFKQEVEIEVFDVTFKIVEKVGFPDWETFPRSEFRISTDANSLDTSSGRMRARERLMSRSELIQLGFQKSQIAKLSAHDAGKSTKFKSDTEYGKAQSSSERIKTDDGTNDASQEKLLVRKVYMDVDYDGDGIAELREIWLSGDSILRWQETGEDANRVVSRDPFHTLCAEPHPGEHFGSSPGVEAVADQDVSTTLLRQTMNNLYQTNEPKQGVSEWALGENTISDLTEPGTTVVRFAEDPNSGHKTLAVPFMAKESFGMLTYLDEKRFARTGVNPQAEALNPEDLKHIQQSVHASAMDVATAKIEMVARTFCETGFKSLLLHLHELTLQHNSRPHKARIRGSWVEVDPRQWRVREDMTVQVGLGVGSREQQMALLERVAGVQAQMMQDPGLRNLTVTPQHVYQSARKMTRLARQDPDRFFKDPGEEMAAPLPEQEQELQLKAQQLQEAQAQIQQEGERLEKDKQKFMDGLKDAQFEQSKFKTEIQHEKNMRQLAQQLADVEQKNRQLEIDRIFERQEMEIKQAKSEDERAEIRSRTAMNVSNAVNTMATARATDLESDANESGLLELAELSDAEEA